MNIDVVFDEAALLLQLVRERTAEDIRTVASVIYKAVTGDNKLMLCGNGGSAADAQHIAAEFVNRFKIERAPLPAMALTTDTSILTSVGNDYTYSDIFAKQVRALGRPGDVLLGISTSGTSPNVLAAFDSARAKGIICVGLCGENSDEMAKRCDHVIAVPSRSTPRIQEMMLIIEHLVCELIDEHWRKDHA